jgi:hypothetical protein
MQLSKLIARMASVIYLSASLGAFFSTDYYRKIAEDLFHHRHYRIPHCDLSQYVGEKLDCCDHNPWLARHVERHLPDRVSAIRSHVIRANAYRFGCKNLPIRCSLPRIVLRLLRVCVARAAIQIIPTNLRRLRRPAMAELDLLASPGLHNDEHMVRLVGGLPMSKIQNRRNNLSSNHS